MDKIKRLFIKLPVFSGIHDRLEKLSLELNERANRLKEWENELINAEFSIRNLHSLVRVFFAPPVMEPEVIDDEEAEPIPFSILPPPVLTAAAREDEIAVIEKIEGHIHKSEVEQLYSLAGTCGNVILELGGFRGKSTAALLLGSQRNGAIVHSVDPLISSESATGGATLVDSEADYKTFLKNVDPWSEHLVFHRKKSLEVEWPGDPIGLFFIDAFHTYEAVRADFNHFLPYLVEDATVAFHDYSPYKPGFPGVVKFVDELLDSGEWLWSDFRGAIITLERSAQSSERHRVIQVNSYLRSAHRKILEFVDINEKLETELELFRKADELASEFEGRGILFKAPFHHMGENMWRADILHLARFADNDEIQASPLLLFENGQLLNPVHAGHDAIRKKGGGSYSHWKEHLYFSTSDNSDPNENGRQYWILFRLGLEKNPDRM